MCVCVCVCVWKDLKDIMLIGGKNQHLQVCKCRELEVTICESHSVVSHSATPQTIQTIKFFRPEYWSEYPFPSPGDLPNPGIEPWSPTQVSNIAGGFCTS